MAVQKNGVTISLGESFRSPDLCSGCASSQVAILIVWMDDRPKVLTICTDCGMHFWTD